MDRPPMPTGAGALVGRVVEGQGCALAGVLRTARIVEGDGAVMARRGCAWREILSDRHVRHGEPRRLACRVAAGLVRGNARQRDLVDELLASAVVLYREVHGLAAAREQRVGTAGAVVCGGGCGLNDRGRGGRSRGART